MLTPAEARLEQMASSPLGTAASVAARALGANQQTQDATLHAGAALEGMGTAALGPRAFDPMPNAQLPPRSVPTTTPQIEEQRQGVPGPAGDVPGGEETGELPPASSEAPRPATSPPVGTSSARPVVESAAGPAPESRRRIIG
jgi:hypothetical protein